MATRNESERIQRFTAQFTPAGNEPDTLGMTSGTFSGHRANVLPLLVQQLRAHAASYGTRVEVANAAINILSTEGYVRCSGYEYTFEPVPPDVTDLRRAVTEAQRNASYLDNSAQMAAIGAEVGSTAFRFYGRTAALLMLVDAIQVHLDASETNAEVTRYKMAIWGLSYTASNVDSIHRSGLDTPQREGLDELRWSIDALTSMLDQIQND